MSAKGACTCICSDMVLKRIIWNLNFNFNFLNCCSDEKLINRSLTDLCENKILECRIRGC